MRTHVLVLSTCLLLCACPPPIEECIDGTEASCPDAGGLPEDLCNSFEEAEMNSRCHLNVTTGGAMVERIADRFISRLADGGQDQDIYFAQMPGNLTARSLLHVNGGYQVPQTAVNFSLNVMNGPAGMSVANGIDKHGPAAPRPVDLIVPFAQSNAKLFVLVADDGAGQTSKVDNRNAYSLFMEIIENPDANEPNDTMPTPIPLTGNMGMASGFLATDNDIDQFSFQFAGGGGRQILYLHVTEIGAHPNPPPPFRLSYTLFAPPGASTDGGMDVPIAEGVMDNEFNPIDLATARLISAPGTYKIQINGFRPAGSTLPIRGNLDLNYAIEVRIIPDLDMLEPNDTKATARNLTMNPNSAQTLTGKLAHVPDEEWFRISLPARASPSTLRYRTSIANSGGRFNPLSGTPTRQIRVMQSVTTGANAAEQLNNCRTDPMICPQAEDAPPALINSVCASASPPLCLYAERNEERPRLADLHNLVGAVPVPANQATEWFVMFRDQGQGASKYADDRDWTMVIEWRDDADEAGRLGGPTQVALGGSTTVSSGELSFGYGYPHRLCNVGCVLIDPDWYDNGNALRGVDDYDAVTSDRDLYEFTFGGATGDQSWEISWDLEHPDGGSEPPGELAFDMTFCGSGNRNNLCANSEEKIMAFNDSQLTPWYLPQSQANARALFTRQNMGNFTRYTVEPVGCPCHSAVRTATGHFFVDLVALYRTSNEPLRYRISQRITAYPGAGFTVDGGAATCPTATGDGGVVGCGFAE
ncbi:MAG: hypothetical protein JNM17_08430 [Archangium sp.]|nr:hypothetical protein [Archangium sp.]